ncbi:acyclic terpene utilization AtuA family protein [Streptomyces xylophagus]|uniref:acyclic terpene utilization AtuA family protein n=1 Tax=Streptomyces xylophagus TaxID=285514 RepID=UPI0006920867|nr:acyclic terpene utilization AtuA family protein [Streptomyces xylophagus]
MSQPRSRRRTGTGTGNRIRIGCGAGFADDRVDPAVELAEHGRLDYLVFECLAERTVALAQLERLRDPDAGYNEWLVERMEAVLEPCARQGTRIITNMGAANPQAAARAVAEVARRLGLPGLRIATVTGDDVLHLVKGTPLPLLDGPGRAMNLDDLGDDVVSANAYLGAAPVAEALAQGADVVVTGRVADPSLFLAPLTHEFGWTASDWPLLARGTAVGHLLECAGQVTGGYYADPGTKDVPDLARLGFPLAEVAEDGSFTLTKVPGSGGRLTVATVTEQLLYEVHDPAAYLTPDVTADFSHAHLTQLTEDQVTVTGITGRERPTALKASVGYRDGFLAHGEISYAGSNALARAREAARIVEERLTLTKIPVTDARYDLIGLNAVHRGVGVGAVPTAEPTEIRLRVAARTDTLDHARRIGREVASLWPNGPYGGAGVTRETRENIAITSVLLPRELVMPSTEVQVTVAGDTA